MKPEDIMIAAKLILESRKLAEPLSSLPIPFQPKTIEDGYRIQSALKDLQHKYSKSSRTGYKIGCTTDVMQNYLSIDHPCAGNITGNLIYHKI